MYENNNSLGISRVVSGVVSSLGTFGTLELDVGGLVGTKPLTIGTDPLMRRSFLVNGIELFLRGSRLVGSLSRGGSEDISANDAKVFQKFSGFRVGKEESDEDTNVGSGCKINVSRVPRQMGKPSSLTSFAILLGLFTADGNDTILLSF